MHIKPQLLSCLLIYMALSPAMAVGANFVSQNFYQQHLRKSRTASGSNSIQSKQAIGRLGARLTGRDLPAIQIPPADVTIINENSLSNIIKLPYSSDSLAKALQLKERMTRPNNLLNEYIALCYWQTGQTIKATELGNSVLRELESPALRRILYSQAMSERSYDLALHHLEKAGLSESSTLAAKIKIFIKKTDFPLLIPVLLFLAALAFGMKIIMAILRRMTRSALAKRTPACTTGIFQNNESSDKLTHNDIKQLITDDNHGETSVYLTDVSEGIHTPYNQSSNYPENSINDQFSERPSSDNYPEAVSPEAPYFSELPSTNSDRFDRCSAIFTEPEDSSIKPSTQINLGFDDETLTTLFVSLQLSLSQHMIRMLSIVSEASSAPKAELALKLGKMFAGDDYKTLLIDCNNTAPFLHEELCTPAASGISDLADPDCEITSIFRPAGTSQLFYITCGMKPFEADCLSESAWELLLDYCRKNYEIIILILPDYELIRQNTYLVRNTGMLIIDKEFDGNHLTGFDDLLAMHTDIKLFGKLSSNCRLTKESIA